MGIYKQYLTELNELESELFIIESFQTKAIEKIKFTKCRPRKTPNGFHWVRKEPGGALGHSTSELRQYWSPNTYGRDYWWALEEIKNEPVAINNIQKTSHGFLCICDDCQ
jgi:hypothetical protein